MKSTNRNRVVEIYTRKFDGLHRMVGVTIEFATEGWTIFLNFIL